jgi:hypothetical protein
VLAVGAEPLGDERDRRGRVGLGADERDEALLHACRGRAEVGERAPHPRARPERLDALAALADHAPAGARRDEQTHDGLPVLGRALALLVVGGDALEHEPRG